MSIFAKKSSGGGGGFWSVMNGLDGCGMVAFIALFAVPGAACPLFIWIARDGIARAFDRDFTQLVVLVALLLIGAAVVWGPFSLWMAARAWAYREPAQIAPPAPAFNIRMMGGGGMEAQPHQRALPMMPETRAPGAIPILLDDPPGRV